MTEQLTYTFTSLLSQVKRHLSVIGKRFTDGGGNNHFSAITTSTAEDALFNDYMLTAAHTALAQIERFVWNYVESATGFAFKVTNERWSQANYPDAVAAFSKAFEKYVVLYTLADYLDMTQPQLAKKYYEDAQRQLNSIIQLMWFKAPPTPANGDTPSVEYMMTFNASNVGTDADPYYAFKVNKSVFTDNQIEKVWSITDNEGAGAVFTIRNAGLNIELVELTSIPYTFTTSDLAAITGAAGNFVVFYPEDGVGISDTDVLTLSYTAIPQQPSQDDTTSSALNY